MFAMISSFWFLNGKRGRDRLDENGARASADVSRVAVVMQVGFASALKGVSQIVCRGKSVMIAHEEELGFISFMNTNSFELRRQETCSIRSQMTIAETVDHRRRDRFLWSDIVRRDPVNVLRWSIDSIPTSIVRFLPEKQQLPNL